MYPFKGLGSTKMILVSLFIIISPLIIIEAKPTSLLDVSNTFYKFFDITWGRTQILNGGQLLNLNLYKASGAGVHSKNQIVHGKFTMQIKLVPGNSAGTVTAFYIASRGPTYDEIGFKFLGNSSGQPYTMQTNVVSQGKDYRVQQFRLWFDPTKDFNTYSITWNRRSIIFYVNDVPIRLFNNMESSGVPFPIKQPTRVYASIINADNWATRGGLVKTDWTKAPFTASFRNYKIENFCPWLGQRSSCDFDPTTHISDSAILSNQVWLHKHFDTPGLRILIKGIQNKFMIYNYCTDHKKFPTGFPSECKAF